MATAKETFGFDSLRPGQQEAIDAILAGRDTIAVLPTGAGKSAIYQIPAVMLDGPTVVISPLIALQKDQVDSLQEHDAGGAALVNSHTRAAEKQEAFSQLEAGELEFIFVTPEQLAKPEILAHVKQAKPSLFVIDEARHPAVIVKGFDRPNIRLRVETFQTKAEKREGLLTALVGLMVQESCTLPADAMPKSWPWPSQI